MQTVEYQTKTYGYQEAPTIALHFDLPCMAADGWTLHTLEVLDRFEGGKIREMFAIYERPFCANCNDEKQ